MRRKCGKKRRKWRKWRKKKKESRGGRENSVRLAVSFQYNLQGLKE